MAAHDSKLLQKKRSVVLRVLHKNFFKNIVKCPSALVHQYIQCYIQLYNMVCNLDKTVILCSWSVFLPRILFVDLLNYSSFLGNYQQALETYKTIHKRFPDNVECKCYYWKSEEKALLPSLDSN